MDTHPSLLSLLSRDLTVVTWDQAKKGKKKKKRVPSTLSLFPKGLFCLVKQPQTLPRLNGERQSSKTLYCPVTLVEKTRWCGESFS